MRRTRFSDLFAQVLMIAAKAVLGRFGTVAIDGTKIKANASIDANRGREWFDRHVAGMLAAADATDRVEDIAASTTGGEERRDRVPADLADRLVDANGSARPHRNCVHNSIDALGPSRSERPLPRRGSGAAACVSALA